MGDGLALLHALMMATRRGLADGTKQFSPGVIFTLSRRVNAVPHATAWWFCLLRKTDNLVDRLS